MRAKIRQLFCLIVIVIIALAIGAAAINVYMVWGTKGRILKKDQWANFKADGVVVLGCAVTVSYTHLTLPTNREV